jgi:MYXO-CTERM domain-containing protein
VTVLVPNGETRFSVPTSDHPILDLVPGRLDGDAVPDLVFHWGEPSNTLTRTRAVSGADGATLWEATPLETGSGRQPAGIAVGRFDGDDRDDVFFQGGATRALSGATGTELAALAGASYFMTTLVDIDADPAQEVVLHGGYGPLRVVDHDLATTLFASTDDDRPYPYGSVVTCPSDRTVLLSGSWEHPSRLKRTELRPTLGTESTFYLAAGRRFATEAELDAASVFAGQLTSVAVHTNLAGDGAPAALVGSSDGFLYWVNACDGSLVHAIDMGVAVGQAVFGDTDGDGSDEILVTAADGYLYGFEHRLAESPAWVNDIDPMSPASTDDVDSVNTVDTLVARWAEVAGIVRYDVGVFEDGGRPLLTPRWQDAGTATEITLTGLALENGHRYYVGVRAISAEGPSVDAVSDGVLVRLPIPSNDGGTPTDGGTTSPDAGRRPAGDSSCACRAGGAPSAARPVVPMALLMLLTAVASRRRRSR